MNKYLLLIGMVVCKSMLYSQSYVPFPTENTYWKGAVIDHEVYWKTYVLLTDGDSIVNGFTYTKLKEKGLFYPWDNQGIPYSTPSFYENYAGCFRNDILNKKVFFIEPDSSIEKLWYDFNLNIGDTIFDYGFDYKVILDIDSVMLDGTYRKRLVIDSCDLNSEPSYFIEGIGSTFGWISDGYCPFESSEELTCVTVDGSIIYNTSSFDSTCSIINSIQNRYRLSILARVYPNPAQNSISIFLESNKRQEFKLSIYDVLGKMIYENARYVNNESISIVGFQNGLYFFKLENKFNTKMYSGKFIKR